MPQDDTQPAAQIDHRLVQLARIMSTAKTPSEYAKLAVKNGADPRYVAMRYLPVEDRERFVKACEAWKAKQGKDA